VDDLDAVRCWRAQGKLHLAAPEPDAAGVRRLVAAQDLDERRLTRSVLADEPVYLAGADLQIDSGECVDAAEALDQAGDPKTAGAVYLLMFGSNQMLSLGSARAA
jgi:hypothetical protein